MTDRFTRRDVLQHSTTTITGLAVLSGETVALQSEAHPESSTDGDYALSPDLCIHNDGTAETTITVTAFPTSADGPVSTGRYSLPGLNDPTVTNPAEAKQAHALDLSGDGTYTFEFRLPDGTTDRTEVRVTETGIDSSAVVTARVKPAGTIEARTIVW